MKILIIGLVLIVLAGCSSSKKKPIEQAEFSLTPSVQENVIESEPTPERAKITESELWHSYNETDLPDLEKRIFPSSFELYRCDYSSVLSTLHSNSEELELPTKQGFVMFILENSSTMNDELAAKYPEIKSFKGKSTDGLLSIRLDTNTEGLFAEIIGIETKQLISPLLKGNKSFYALHDEDALPPSPRGESFD
tara:strand:+ start:483 stop:1064 length:582 start_codon:yes stop_codon:yes gene_type:complete